MEQQERREQTPEEAQRGKEAAVKRRYNIPLMTQTLQVAEKKILFSAKKLPKGWTRKDAFPHETVPHDDMSSIIQTVRTAKVDTIPHEVLKENHQKIVSFGGEGTHYEWLFLRYARKFFKK